MTTTHTQPAGCDLDSLPAKPHTTYNGYSDGSEPLWTAEQMEDYARAAIAAARAAQAPQGDTRQGATVGLSNADLYTLRRVIECVEKMDERPRPMCRDCADENGTCPNSGLECDMGMLITSAKSIYNRLAAPAAHTCTPADERAINDADALHSTILNVLRNHRMVRMFEVEDGGALGNSYPLIDRLCLDDGADIESGQIEVDALAWAIADEITKEKDRAAQGAGTAPTYWNSQRKMIERAIIGLRDGWATRKDADDALAMLATHPAPVSTAAATTASASSERPITNAEEFFAEARRLGCKLPDDLRAFLASAPSRAADGQQGANRMTERKAKEIGEREGMALAGYVFQSDDGRACIIHQGAVRWLSNEELWSIVHPADGQQGASRAALDLSASGLMKLWQQAQDTATNTMPAPFQFAKLLLARAPLPAQATIQPTLMRQAVASVVSRSGDDLRIGWLRPERCDVGTLLYCAVEPSRAQSDTTGDLDA